MKDETILACKNCGIAAHIIPSEQERKLRFTGFCSSSCHVEGVMKETNSNIKELTAALEAMAKSRPKDYFTKP